jgi:hypothetical protein
MILVRSIVSLSFVLLIIYTIAVLIIFAKTGLEPETMTKYFVGAIIGEFGFLSGIKVTKEIREWRKKRRNIIMKPIIMPTPNFGYRNEFGALGGRGTKDGTDIK